MIIVEESCVLLAVPAQIWPLLADFNRWKEWLFVQNAGETGVGNAMKVLGGEAGAQQLGIYYDKDPKELITQTGKVLVWNPPTHVAIALGDWNPETGRVVNGMRLPGAYGAWVGRMRALSLRLDVILEPVSVAETKMTVRFDGYFTDEFFGRFLNLFLPWGLGKTAKFFVKKFPLVLEASPR